MRRPAVPAFGPPGAAAHRHVWRARRAACAIALGAGRIEAVVAAGLLALALTAAVAAVGAALDRRRGR